MTYHDNVVRFKLEKYQLFKGEDGHYGSFKILNHCITDGEDPDSQVKNDTTYNINNKGELSFSFGRQGSEKVAKWWNDKVDSEQTTFHNCPQKLNFAAIGDLTLNIKREDGSETKLIIPNIAIAQGHTGASNNWWFGGEQFLYVGANTVYGSKNNYDIKTIVTRGGNDVNEIIIRFDEYKNIEWMKSISDRPVNKMSIPGTHDSGTARFKYFPNVGIAHCQNFGISEQLRDGIRFFDLRLFPFDNISHNIVICEESWTSIMKEMSDFLDKHNKEFIIVLLGAAIFDLWTKSMIETVEETFKNNSKLFIGNFSGNISIDQLRGKIVVLKRQADCPVGTLLKFEDNKTFENGNFSIEDEYKEHDTNVKLETVTKHLSNAKDNKDGNKFYITFNSIAGTFFRTPYAYAWGGLGIDPEMNPALLSYLKKNTQENKYFGVILLDFYSDHGDKSELIDAIIAAN